jgi:putative membrane protein
VGHLRDWYDAYDVPVLAAIIVGIVLLIRWLLTTHAPGQRPMTGVEAESALDILKKRYARGEISKPEFEAMRRDLQEHV